MPQHLLPVATVVVLLGLGVASMISGTMEQAKVEQMRQGWRNDSIAKNVSKFAVGSTERILAEKLAEVIYDKCRDEVLLDDIELSTRANGHKEVEVTLTWNRKYLSESEVKGAKDILKEHNTKLIQVLMTRNYYYITFSWNTPMLEAQSKKVNNKPNYWFYERGSEESDMWYPWGSNWSYEE